MVTLHLKPEVPCAAEKGIIANQDLRLVADSETTADFKINYDPCQDEGIISFQDASMAKPGTITSWNWDFGNGMTSTAQNPNITLSESAELTVTLEIKTDNDCNGASSRTQSYSVVNFPEIPPSLQICPGIPTELNPNNSTEGIDYKWTPADVLDNPNGENPIATTIESTDFIVKMTQGNCVRESLVKADVPAEQDYNLSEDETVCDDTERLIFVEAPANSTIEWTDVSTGQVISQDAEIMVQPGLYQVKLTDENNCPVMDVVAIENFAIDAAIIDNTNPLRRRYWHIRSYEYYRGGID